MNATERIQLANDIAQMLNGLALNDANDILNEAREKIRDASVIALSDNETASEDVYAELKARYNLPDDMDEELAQKLKRVFEATCPTPLLIELQKLAPYLKLDVSDKPNRAHLWNY